MYTGYFGLKEKPFSIAPNPQYLFMSDRHREALTHLTYGLGGSGLENNGGFVLLTGEVGTGKTTISRCVMEQLPENTQAAFILNPTLSSQELLATICDELKIRYKKTGATLKTLTDKIQEKLLKNHQNNINTLLIIDEAQHLLPEVLEQLRLLTNLETNTKKLLQVVLIGQPELQMLLKRRDLRQLAQRITARYHLLPLNKSEVALYIKHRLSVAQCFRELFSTKAIAAIHQISDGIPRVINLICERALINAYSSNNAVISKKIVIGAAQDALGDDYHLAPWWQHKMLKTLAASTLLFTLVFAGYYFGQHQLGQHQQSSALVAQKIDTTQEHLSEQGFEKKSENMPIKKSILVEKEPLVVADVSPPENTNTAKSSMTNNVVQSLAERGAEHLAKQENQVELLANNIVSENVNQEVPNEVNYQVNATEGVSEDLLMRFQDAIDETGNNKQSNEAEPSTREEIAPLADMPQWLQQAIPNLEFTMHIYASDGAGWVTVNGRDRYEGDYIERELLLSEILPQKVVLNFRGEKFTVAALSSW
ncbi:MAG: AAA family ATPase [Colwellia sp.]|nr:AAA family ATPase [Colwellia sp.]